MGTRDKRLQRFVSASSAGSPPRIRLSRASWRPCPSFHHFAPGCQHPHLGGKPDNLSLAFVAFPSGFPSRPIQYTSCAGNYSCVLSVGFICRRRTNAPYVRMISGASMISLSSRSSQELPSPPLGSMCRPPESIVQISASIVDSLYQQDWMTSTINSR